MVVREGVSSYTRPHITASPSWVSVQRSKEGFLSAGFFSTKSKTLWRAKDKGKEHTPIYQSLSRQKGQDHYVPLIAKESFSSKIECFGIRRAGRGKGENDLSHTSVCVRKKRQTNPIYLSLTGLLTAIRGLNIHSHLYLRVLSPPGPCQALTINYNNQTIWILKLSLFLTIQLVPIPQPPTAHKALDTSVLA